MIAQNDFGVMWTTAAVQLTRRGGVELGRAPQIMEDEGMEREPELPQRHIGCLWTRPFMTHNIIGGSLVKFEKMYNKNLKVKIGNFKISRWNNHLSNNGQWFNNYCLRSLKGLSGNIGIPISMLKKKKFKNLSHNQSTVDPNVSIETAVAEASIMLSHIMEWVNHQIILKN